MKNRLGEALKSATISRRNRVKILVDKSRILEAAQAVKAMGFDHIHVVSGTDYPKQGEIEIAYILSSLSVEDLRSLVILLATRVPRKEARLPTLIPIWPGAEYHEREQWEMLGIAFEGHPRLQYLLLPEDWNQPPPLLKDFKLKKWDEEERAQHGLVVEKR